ncbi:MAG: NAD(P)/FAD-dependent oxidoreductase [candidate division WOR-3 bacterium]
MAEIGKPSENNRENEEGKILSENDVEVNGKVFKTRYIIIATGSRPFIPPIKGLDTVPYLTNLNIFSLKELPKKLLIIGGGYIGVELSQAFRRFGSEVYVVEMANQILPQEDEDIAYTLKETLENEGVKIYTDCVVESVSISNGNISAKCKDKNGEFLLNATHILVAAGRMGNTEGLGLENIGVKVDGKRFVITDDTLRTSVKTIFAVGDVNGKSPFVYVGAREGKLAVRNALLSENNKLNYNVVPYVVFTDPQVSGVGAGERFLKGLEIEYGKSVLDYNDIPIAGLIPNTKLFSHNGKIIGVRIIGKLAGELITPYTIAMGLGVSKDKLMDVLYPFLTFSEGIIELLCGIKVGAGISIDPKNPSPRKPSPLLMPVRPPILPRVP